MAEKVGGIYYEVAADTKPLVDATRVVDRETAKMAASFNAITAAVKVLAVAMTLIKAAQMADDMRLMGARVEVAAGSIQKAAQAMAELQRIATRTQTAVAANVQVFTRLNQSLLQMGGTQADTLRLTELLGMAVKVSGASAVESASAMLQFGQALGSGKLAGDELRSLLENAPYLMRQLAAGIGVPVGALKKLGEEGKLTADVVVNALQKAAGQIEGDFAKMPQTLGAAFTSAVDALQRLIEKTDESTGTSAVLTGVTKGLGEAMDALARQIDGASTAADGLGRSGQIDTWANRTRSVVSYLVDALDSAAQKLTAIWETTKLLNRIVTGPIERFARGKDGGFYTEAGKARPLISPGADSPDGQTAGERMRAEWETQGWSGPGAGPARGRVPPPSKLKAPRDADADKKAAAAAKKAAEARTKAYLDGLEGEARIQAEQDEATRKFYEKQQEDEKRAADERARAQASAQDMLFAGDPIAALQLELQRKRELLDEYAAADMANLALYSQAKIALEQQTAEKIAAVVKAAEDKKTSAQRQALQGYGEMFGSMAEIQKTFAGEQDGVYRALFTASKAFAIAEAIVKIQAGIANAAALPFPANLGAMATVAASTAGIVATIRGTNYGGGRQYGGPTSAGSLYRVNETGRPEMFTAANGSQYMLPTQSGRVTAADKVGGGATVVELRVINQMPGAQVTQRAGSDGRPEIVIAEIADQISSRRGPVWAALGTTNVRGRI